MAKRHSVCLVLFFVVVYAFFYAWSLMHMSDLLWSSDGHSLLLAKDTLQAARDSVREAMVSHFMAQGDEYRIAFEQGAMNHLNLKLARLESSLDNIHGHGSPPHNQPVKQRPVKGHPRSDAHRDDICQALLGKQVTMIGGEHIYRLHAHLLRSRERAEGKLFPCPYHEFCTHHHICLPYQSLPSDVPPPRYVKPPTMHELVETRSAVIKYVVSDTLLSGLNQSSWEYNLPFVDRMTGIRLRETYWLVAARKANVVILGRGPLSAPSQTYTGNWTFLCHVPDYVDESRISTPAKCKDSGHDDKSNYEMAPRSLEILNAAVHLTVSRFLPDLFQLLWTIRQEVRPSRHKQLIWAGSWYRLPGRGTARTALLHPDARSIVQDMTRRTSILKSRSRPHSTEHTLVLQLSAYINADIMNTTLLEDPWALLFNAQVYLENMVLKELLPRHGIVFLPLHKPWVEDSQAPEHGHGHPLDTISINFERTMAIGEAFLAGMDHILRYLK